MGKAREAQVIGILIATLSVSNFTEVAAKLRAMIAAAGAQRALHAKRTYAMLCRQEELHDGRG